MTNPMGSDRKVSESVELSFAHRLQRSIFGRIGQRLRDALGATLHIMWNALMSWLGRTDYKRWTSPEGLEEWWDGRTKQIASLVPLGTRVIEFGAGRRQLEKYLSAGCTYTPSDLVDRGWGTIVCDLNHRPLPDLSHVAPEVAVFGGVLEYVRDVPGLLQWLTESGVKTCITSFDPSPVGLGIIGRYRESARRTYYGYMNNLTEEQLERSFAEAGFARIRRQTWTTQSILQFQRQP